MKLNKLEFIAMNSSVRGIIQEKYEARIMRTLSSVSDIKMALEMGCGNGTGGRIIKKLFHPENLTGIDMDEKMVYIAKKRNLDPSVTFQIMDAAKLEFPDHYFDAVFDFGIIHHIPNWKNCIREMHRVLKPGGKLILEDLSHESFSGFIGKIYSCITDHPYREMFKLHEFIESLAASGFRIDGLKKYNPLGLVKLFFLTATKEK